MALEEIGPIGTLMLYTSLGSGTAFSGGKAPIVGLSKNIGNRQLRSVPTQGALATNSVRTSRGTRVRIK